jgi:type IV pilus assembly protein PilO
VTNLNPAARRPLLRRDHLLVGIPAVTGVFISIAVLVLLVQPARQRVGELETRVGDLQALQRRLPNLEGELDGASLALRRAQLQQGLLVDLIAGRDRIRTFLALLNREAAGSGVAIQLYEPMASQAAAAPPPPQAGQGEKAAKPSGDPLLALGYTKTSIALRVLGPYDGLQRFLQRMETLQVLVESSDLALESRDDGEISLGLRLSFYDRQPSSESEKPAAEADQQTSTPPPA